MKYPERIILSIDQLLNTILGGYPEETLSSRCYRQGVLGDRKWWWRSLYKLVNGLFFWQEDHCKKAYERAVSGKYRPF